MMLEKKLFWVLLLITCFLSKKAYAQDIDLENVYKPNFKVSGAVNANAVFYNSNQESSREPFTYLLSGSLNFSALVFRFFTVLPIRVRIQAIQHLLILTEFASRQNTNGSKPISEMRV